MLMLLRTPLIGVLMLLRARAIGMLMFFARAVGLLFYCCVNARACGHGMLLLLRARASNAISLLFECSRVRGRNANAVRVRNRNANALARVRAECSFVRNLLRARGRNARLSGFFCASQTGMPQLQDFFWKGKRLAGPHLECSNNAIYSYLFLI
jgi:hypothetical protein